MSDPLISVVVPVYKVEEYLEKCVNSIRNQTYKNLEIILVDDGSPDRCGEMCEALAKEDSRIRVLHKENGGLSSARNAGLDVMQGEYVGFVDSDDWIDAQMYESLYNLMKEENAQIAACGTYLAFSDGRVDYYYPNDGQSYAYHTQEALRELLLNRKITNSACDKLFTRGIFDAVRMKVGIFYEDLEMMPRCIERAQKVVYTSTPYYHYIMTEDSITRGGFKKSRFAEAENSWDRAEHYGVYHPKLYSYAVAAYVEIALNLVYETAELPEFKEQCDCLIRQLREVAFVKTFFALQMNGRIKYLAFLLGVPAYLTLMSIYSKRGR